MSQSILFTVMWFHGLVLYAVLSAIMLYRRPTAWQHLFCIFLGLLTGLTDLGSDELQLTVLLLLVFGFFMGYLQPLRAWRWGLLLAVWVPALQLASILITADSARLDGVGSLLAFAPALLGSYLGVFLRGMVPQHA